VWAAAMSLVALERTPVNNTWMYNREIKQARVGQSSKLLKTSEMQTTLSS